MKPLPPRRPEEENLPEGVTLRTLDLHEDSRGSLFEMYRDEWFPDAVPARQYQLLRSCPGVLRGFHVHAVHHDYLSVVSGSFLLGLRDMRPWSATFGLIATLAMDACRPESVHIPPGVGHGFCFVKDCSLVLAVSHYYNLEDELACRWDDPELGIDWGLESPQISERDRAAGSYPAMQEQLLSLMR